METLQVLRDGEADYNYMPEPPSMLDTIVSHVGATVGSFIGKVSLETKMLTYDTLHSSHYRQIRHDLVKKQKEAKFLESIGLVKVVNN